MDLNTVLSSLQETQLSDAVQPHWEEAMAAFPPCRPSFLTPEEFKISREWCGFDKALDSLLENTAEQIVNNPALFHLAWYYYWRIFEGSDRSFKACPRLEILLGEQGGIFYLLIGLAWVPRLRAYHQSLGVPEDVTRETYRQVHCYCDNYRRAHSGRLGIFIQQLSWLKNYLNGNLYFRLGRLEYWAKPFDGEVEAYRNRQTGDVIALSANGHCFDSQGYRDGPTSMRDAEHWTALLEKTNTSVRGFPLLPAGKAIRREVCLPLTTWPCVLAKGDPILDIHIPAGGDMSIERCGDSLRRAVNFFHQYFPERSPRAFVCKSWILSPYLEDILPPTSNLVRFQRELYLYPPEGTCTNVWFVFLQDRFDPATAPRETSLQRAIYDFLKAGHLWRNGNMFLLVDDLKHFGHQYYRSHWPQGVLDQHNGP